MKVSRRQFLLSSGAFFALGAFGEGFRLDRKIVIAHVSDVHVSTADKTGAIDRVVAEINADPEIDFVVVTGDLQNRGETRLRSGERSRHLEETHVIRHHAFRAGGRQDRHLHESHQ